MDKQDLDNRFAQTVEPGTPAQGLRDVLHDAALGVDGLIDDGPIKTTLVQHLEKALHVALSVPEHHERTAPAADDQARDAEPVE
jgi:hypothetical protein